MSTGVTMSWDGDDEGELPDPTTDDVGRRIRRLDGFRRTIVTLQSGAGYLGVGGSAAQGLILYVELGDGSFWTARSPETSSTGLVRVVAGGQPGDHQARLVTTTEVALTAAVEFLASGRLSQEVEWEPG